MLLARDISVKPYVPPPPPPPEDGGDGDGGGGGEGEGEDGGDEGKEDTTHGETGIQAVAKPPAFTEAKNWKDLLKTISNEDSLSVYNVVIVDPVFESYSHSTRVRFFHDVQDEKVKVKFTVEVGRPRIVIDITHPNFSSLQVCPMGFSFPFTPKTRTL